MHVDQNFVIPKTMLYQNEVEPKTTFLVRYGTVLCKNEVVQKLCCAKTKLCKNEVGAKTKFLQRNATQRTNFVLLVR
ncbi:hypothetical protein EON70_00260 [bacterium]|nr:MAG: hypothetical protein EON70_00260 [bacterium]